MTELAEAIVGVQQLDDRVQMMEVVIWVALMDRSQAFKGIVLMLNLEGTR